MDRDPEDHSSPELLSAFTPRRLRLIAHYCDPTSPAYGNATKAAELAGFKGCPGSNQLAVQGHRTLAKARRHPGLLNLLIDTDCTLNRALQRVSACMDAKVHRVFLNKDSQVVHVEAGDNHPVQLQAAKLVIDLHGGLGRVTHQEPLPAAAAGDMAEPADQEELSDKAMDATGENHPSNHVSLQDVVEGNSMSQESRAREHADVQENKSSTMGVTLPGNTSTSLLAKLKGIKEIAVKIDPTVLLWHLWIEMCREFELAREAQTKGKAVDTSKLLRNLCMIVGMLNKLRLGSAAYEGFDELTSSDDFHAAADPIDQTIAKLNPAEYDNTLTIMNVLSEYIDLKKQVDEHKSSGSAPSTEEKTDGQS
jgi:hypothetical protein